MDRARLERYLAEGLSLEKIGNLEGKNPSTVAHWVKKHGLEPAYPQHGRRVEIDEDELRDLAKQDLTLAEIAERLAASQSTVKRRLDRLGIVRRGASRKHLALAARQSGRTRFTYECRWHGVTDFLAMPGGRSR